MSSRNNRYRTISSFSGSDMIVYAIFPGAPPVYIGTLSTLSYSTYRETRHVRTMSRISSKGVTRGPRTVAGSMVFTVLNQHFVNDIMESLREVDKYRDYDKMKPDELPPFDIVVSFANEYGQAATMVIYGISFIDDGMVLSIEDIFTETTHTYIARDIRIMKEDRTYDLLYEQSYELRGSLESVGIKPVQAIYNSEEYQAYIQRMKDLAAQMSGDTTVERGRAPVVYR